MNRLWNNKKPYKKGRVKNIAQSHPLNPAVNEVKPGGFIAVCNYFFV